MMRRVLLLALLFAACDADEPLPNPKADADFIAFEVTVLNGRGELAPFMDVRIEARAAGCHEPALWVYATTANAAKSSGLLTSNSLPPVVCIVATSTPQYFGPSPPAWAVVTSRRDSIVVAALDSIIHLTNAYDHSVISTDMQRSNGTVTSLANVKFELITQDSTVIADPVARVGPFRVEGNTPVTMSAKYESAEHVAEVTLTRQIGRDGRYGFTVWLSRADPTNGCFGCIAKASVPVKTHAGVETGDSLSIVWGGGLPITIGAVF
jgi:hypothetical protein